MRTALGLLLLVFALCVGRRTPLGDQLTVGNLATIGLAAAGLFVLATQVP